MHACLGRPGAACFLGDPLLLTVGLLCFRRRDSRIIFLYGGHGDISRAEDLGTCAVARCFMIHDLGTQVEALEY